MDDGSFIKAMMKPARYDNCVLATMQGGSTPYGLIDDASIIVRDGVIAWCGPSAGLPGEYCDMDGIDLGGRLVTPALIDCHTHLVYGGNRAREFEMRLNGASYEEIARSGGGILSTVMATREVSDQELRARALARVDALMADGVRVFEVKSGYGLTVDDEIRMLRIARDIAALRPVTVKTTWLAAHALPPEYKGRADDYIDEIVIPGLELANAAGLVDAVDGFCEDIAFSSAQIERVFQAARRLSLPVKLHAEQLTDQKGALLVANYGGLSADHLEYLHKDDVPIFAKSGAVAVLLPGAYYFLKETKLPPIADLRQHNVPMAVATDCNPGSSPIFSMLMALNMACVFFGLTPEEALAGATRNAARALGLEGQYGTLTQGAFAEFAVWNVDHPSVLAYEVGARALHQIISHRSNA